MEISLRLSCLCIIIIIAGTWSKHPKATTELDQIAIGCCLKTTEHTADSSRCTGSNFDVHHHCQTQPMHHFSKRTLCIVV
ncbi:hypothetical protein M404DRAFT_515974 [Pisolithus tinctorius Marx 270]|uniref:Secreted protein n=1 Tax=Pisolithus tinctorius Marx 270 TaxID=870435 RepID=A0A0C3MWS1_PISTI|nr:hypothetical protein M404DRAFT_515974 [Pisolithus tinctorius Marx 270]